VIGGNLPWELLDPEIGYRGALQWSDSWIVFEVFECNVSLGVNGRNF
jgi:hypothetical protein